MSNRYARKVGRNAENAVTSYTIGYYKNFNVLSAYRDANTIVAICNACFWK